jgi:hypothetical protein
MDEDDVFRAPPKEFTAARDGLAAALKAAGRVAEAKAVKAWRRPALPVWLWNRLFLDGEESAQEIVEVAAALGDAVEGAETPDLAEKVAALRAAGGELLAQARELTTRLGIGFSTAQERELTELVQALPWSRVAREEAARGHLREPPPPVDPLEAMRFLAGGAPLPPEPQVEKEEQEREAKKRELARAEAALAEAEAARASAEKAREQAHAGVARAERVLVEAEQRLEQALEEERSRREALERLR